MVFWKKYLTIISGSIIVMGLYVTFFKNTPMYSLFSNLIDPVFWPDKSIIQGTQDFKGFIYSFSGVFVLLWGLNFFFISRYALLRGNRWAWNCIAVSTLTWVLIMIPFSIVYKVYYNAIGNVLFFIIIAIPMIKIRKFIYA
jgi:hypothetical protein